MIALSLLLAAPACGPGNGSQTGGDASSTADAGSEVGSQEDGGTQTATSYDYEFIAASNVRGICGVTTGGKIVCRGSSTFPTPPARKYFVSEKSNYKRVSVSQDHFCGLTESSDVKCWGLETFGESGSPSGTYQQVAASVGFTCLLDGSGSVTCSGQGGKGQTEPPEVTATAIAGGGNSFACLLTAEGKPKCWGSDAFGTLETPSTSFKTISVGKYHVCGVKKDGSIGCWGTGTDPEAMFDGFEAGQAAPPSGAYTEVAAGGLHTCALDGAGQVDCWGMGSKPGEKEDPKVGSFDHDQASPPDATFEQIVAGSDVSCGLTSGGDVTCWGREPDGVALP